MIVFSETNAKVAAAYVKAQAACEAAKKDSTNPAFKFAHVRRGSGAGIGQKPDDWRGVSLCAEHHRRQHNIGEQAFWRGIDVEGLIAAFIAASPRRAQIEQAMRERRNA